MKHALWFTALMPALMFTCGCTPQGSGPLSNDNSNANSGANDNVAGNDNSPGTGAGDLVIHAVTPDAATDQLFLSGEFGDEPGLVTVGGVTLNVVSWGPSTPAPQQIVCDLPRDAYGDVQVQSGTQFSNTAQLTRWDLHLTSTTNILDPGSTGEITIVIDVGLTLRACLNNLLADGDGAFSVLAAVSRDSTAVITASGTLTANTPPPGYTLSSISAITPDPQDFLVIYPGDVTDPEVDRFTLTDFVAYANRDGGGGGLKLLFTMTGYYTEIQRLDALIFTSEQTTGFATNTFLDTSQTSTFSFDENFNIVGGEVSAIEDANTTLEWQQAAPLAPPED